MLSVGLTAAETWDGAQMRAADLKGNNGIRGGQYKCEFCTDPRDPALLLGVHFMTVINVWMPARHLR